MNATAMEQSRREKEASSEVHDSTYNEGDKHENSTTAFSPKQTLDVCGLCFHHEVYLTPE